MASSTVNHAAGVVIDLCDEEEVEGTSSRSIQTDSNGTILLLSDSDDDDDREPSQRGRNRLDPSKKKRGSPVRKTKKKQPPTTKGNVKRRGGKLPSARSDHEPSDGTPYLHSSSTKRRAPSQSPPAAKVVAAGATAWAFRPCLSAQRAIKSDLDSADEEDGEDDDCLLVGSKGTNALTDFPHSRENCVLAPMAVIRSAATASASREDSINRKYCANCYCYVCDIPAAECDDWNAHCHARHKDPMWQELRANWSTGKVKKARNPPTIAATVPVQGSTVPVLVRQPGQPNGEAARQDHPFRDHPTTPQQYSVQELLRAVTNVYPSEVSPPSSVVLTTLKHYQKQSLAFMQDVERSKDSSILGQQLFKKKHLYFCLGGWLASEVGMGKTLVVIALVASDEGNPLPSLRLNQNRRRFPPSMTRVKATVVVTSVSLMGQWEDEVRKHAPSLKCLRLHTSKSKYKGMDLLDPTDEDMMKDADIIVTSAVACKAGFIGRYEFNRVVLDEAHLLGGPSMRGNLEDLCAQRRWCVTATPCASSPSDLSRQLAFVGHGKGRTEKTLLDAFRGGQEEFFLAAVDLLKKLMTRHTKDQRMNGSKALALPKSTTKVINVSMKASERQSYDECRKSISKNHLQTFRREGCHSHRFHILISNRLLHIGTDSKVKALLQDLTDLRQTNPNIRVVVFTHVCSGSEKGRNPHARVFGLDSGSNEGRCHSGLPSPRSRC
jgi:SNF2-related domain